MKYLIILFLIIFNFSFSENIKQEEFIDSPAYKGFAALIAEDYEEAAKWYMLAADQGDPDAQFFMGSFYSEGLGVPINLQKSLEYYKLAAEQGNPQAQFNLGLYYIQKVPSSENEAKKWFNLAADQGIADAQFALGTIYSTEGNEKEALYWYEFAVKQGHALSQTNLGLFYVQGKAGLPVNYFKAVEYFQLAAEQEEPNGQFNLGFAYEQGLGLKQNYDKALYWYGKSCDNQYQSGCDKYRYLNTIN